MSQQSIQLALFKEYSPMAANINGRSCPYHASVITLAGSSIANYAAYSYSQPADLDQFPEG
jgi:hypothetical protein